MKKKVLAIILISMSIGLVGCNSQAAQKKEDTTDNTTTQESTTEITIDQAKEIALKHANLTMDNVTFMRAEDDYDNGVKKYDIEFSYDNKEYDYEISAADGKIISSTVEDNTTQGQQTQQSTQQQAPQTQQQTQQSTTQQQTQQQAQQPTQQQPQASQSTASEITVEKAKEIALKHANLTSDQVSFLKAELDVDDGVRKYEVDFTYNNREYDYDINASNGSIISYEID